MVQKIAILLMTTGIPADGDDPLLNVVDGKDQFSRTTARACSIGISVFVTIAINRMEIAKAIASEPVTIVPVPSDQADLASALRVGIKSLPKGLDGVLLTLAHMTALTADDLSILLTHFAELGAHRLISATDDSGHPGFPLVLPSKLFPMATGLRPNQSILSLLHKQKISLVRLTNGHAKTDIDRPEGWVAWRARSISSR